MIPSRLFVSDAGPVNQWKMSNHTIVQPGSARHEQPKAQLTIDVPNRHCDKTRSHSSQALSRSPTSYASSEDAISPLQVFAGSTPRRQGGLVSLSPSFSLPSNPSITSGTLQHVTKPQVTFMPVSFRIARLTLTISTRSIHSNILISSSIRFLQLFLQLAAIYSRHGILVVIQHPILVDRAEFLSFVFRSKLPAY